MAILPDVPGLEVYVEVDGKPAEEFFDPNDYSDGPRRMRRYIEAIPGASFQVVARTTSDFRPDFDSLKLQLILDGTIRSSHTKDYDELYNGRGWSDRFKGRTEEDEHGEMRFMPYQFHPLDIVEENISNEEADEFKRTLRHVGELEWSCEPVELDYAPRRAFQRQSRTQQFYRGQVPAKVAILMKKSQSVGLGRAARRQKRRNDDRDENMRTIYGKVRGARGPFPTFTFCYRTQEELRGLRSCNEEPYEDYRRPVDDIPKLEPRDGIDASNLRSTTPRPPFSYNDVDWPLTIPDHERLDYSDIDRSYYRASIPDPPQYRRIKTPEPTQLRRVKSPGASQMTQTRNPALDRVTTFMPQGSPLIDLTQEPGEEPVEEDLIMFSPIQSARNMVDDDPEDLMMLIDELDGEIANTQYGTSQAGEYLGFQAQSRNATQTQSQQSQQTQLGRDLASRMYFDLTDGSI